MAILGINETKVFLQLNFDNRITFPFPGSPPSSPASDVKPLQGVPLRAALSSRPQGLQPPRLHLQVQARISSRRRRVLHREGRPLPDGHQGERDCRPGVNAIKTFVSVTDEEAK